jgi:hypothetical protein
VREPGAGGKTVGVDGESWFGDRSTLRPGHKPKRTSQTGQQVAPARQGASANYIPGVGPQGRAKVASDFSQPHPTSKL